MDYQAYFQQLIQLYSITTPLQLVISSRRLEQPCSMQGQVLYIDGTQNYDYTKLIQEFIVFHIIQELSIKLDTIEIKSVSLKDLDAYMEIISNPKINYLEASTPVTNRNVGLRRLMSSKINGKGIYLEDYLIGFIGISKDSARASIAVELGYSINENYWNRSIGTICINALSNYLLNNSPITLVSARILEENIASQRVLEKSGFTLEGIRKQSLFHPMTQEIISTIVYSKERAS